MAGRGTLPASGREAKAEFIGAGGRRYKEAAELLSRERRFIQASSWWVIRGEGANTGRRLRYVGNGNSVTKHRDG